jgi:hypothetical protein
MEKAKVWISSGKNYDALKQKEEYHEAISDFLGSAG